MANPYVSIVILTQGEAKSVLQDLRKQKYQNFEVIMAKEDGIVNAMNKALEKARGEIFVRIDDDVSLPKEWLMNLIEPFKYKRIAGTTGPTWVPKERRAYRDSIRYAENPHPILKWLYDNGRYAPACIRECGCVSYDSNFEERGSWFGDPDHLEGTNWAMRTELIRRVGGFDPKFDGVAEWFDTDVVYKVKKLGYEIRYLADANLYHNLEIGPSYHERFQGFGRIKNFLRFHWRHGRWRFLRPKFYIFLMIWMGYFIWKKIKK